MFSALLTASPAASSLLSIVSGFVFLVSSTILPALKNTENDLYAGSTPSRTSGNPTPVLLQQNDHGFFKSLLIIICFTVTLASGSWARSPRSGRLKREGNAPPPPPPPPPPQQIPLGDLTADDEDDGHAGNGDDGEDDPDQEGDGDGQTERDGDGYQVGAAPAPEDPPPPGGLEDEEGDINSNPDGLPWLVFLVVGSILLAVTKRLWRRNGRKTTSVKKPSAKNPGLLERQIAVVDDLGCAYKAPSSIVQGLLLRAQPTLISTAHLHTAVSPTFPAASSLTSVARKAWRIFAWRKAYILLAVVPGLGFLAAIIRLLTLQNRHRIPEIVAERPALAPEPVTPSVARLEAIAWPAPEPDDDPHLESRAPPPSPVSPQGQRPLPPLSLRDPATQAVCHNMLTLIQQKTALRMARAQQDVEANESTKRVREVQRRIWGLLCELYEEGAGAEEV
ncbi:hypothetical protein C8R46DRAFT_1310179 [Mycena filopes]|nr:hypothetical protein C8R46DRAFT_1310179 [Mycena filopes]